MIPTSFFHEGKFIDFPDETLERTQTVPLWYIVQFANVVTIRDIPTLENSGFPFRCAKRRDKNQFVMWVDNTSINTFQSHNVQMMEYSSFKKLPPSEEYKSTSRFMVFAHENWKTPDPKWKIMSYDEKDCMYIIEGVDDVQKLIKDMSVYEFWSILPSELFNGKTASFMQGGNYTPYWEYNKLASFRFLNMYGLDGQGQIANLADSGLDHRNCFFNDPSFPTLPTRQILKAHRKIIGYWPYVDGDAEQSDHGTHCSGSLAGEVTDTTNDIRKYNGQAPKAKIFFCDISNDVRAVFPDRMYNDIVTYSKNMNSMNNQIVGVSSHSYGWSLPYYHPIVCQMAQRYSINMPNTLYFFAAGNDWFEEKTSNSARNTVGVANLDYYSETFSHTQATYGLRIRLGNREWYIPVNREAVIHNGNTELSSYASSPTKPAIYNLYRFKNYQEFQNSAPPNGAAIFIETVSLNEIQSMYLSNGIPIFIVYEDQNIVIPPVQSGPVLNIIRIPNNYRSIINGNFQNGNLEVLLHYPQTLFRSPTSSQGPGTGTGIIKPDIGAPGTIIYSARGEPPSSTATSVCSLNGAISGFSGTSMATPNVAGLTLLIRQFFDDGYYPTGSKVEGNKIVPQAQLLRALLLNGAQPMNTSIPDYTPNTDTGFGVANGMRSLGLTPSLVDRKPNLRILEKEVAKPSKHYKIPFNLQDNSYNCSVTVSWNDANNEDQYHSIRGIFADLVLVLETPNHKMYFGNQNPFYKESHLSNNQRVRLTKQETISGQYTIHIFTNDFEEPIIEMNNVNFSIAVTGSFASSTPYKLSATLSQDCLNGCSNHGTCNTTTGTCSCDPNYTGSVCHSNVPTLEVQEFATTTTMYTFPAYPYVMNFFKIPTEKLKVHVANSLKISLVDDRFAKLCTKLSGFATPISGEDWYCTAANKTSHTITKSIFDAAGEYIFVAISYPTIIPRNYSFSVLTKLGQYNGTKTDSNNLPEVDEEVKNTIDTPEDSSSNTALFVGLAIASIVVIASVIIFLVVKKRPHRSDAFHP